MSRRLPSIQALSCFDAAARHRSYTRAAQELSMTQGAVSRQIAALEAFLGVALFRRVQHGVALTPTGASYARKVAHHLSGLEYDALDAMADSASGGSLYLAAVPTFATRWLLPRLPDLARRHPEIVVHVDTRTRPFLFAETQFDAALYAGTAEQVAQWPGTRRTLLLAERVAAVASPRLLGRGKRWRAADVARLPLLQQSTRPEAWRQWFDAQGLDAPQAMRGPRYELFSMLATAAAHGLGVALIPPLLIEQELARGELVVVGEAPLQGERGYYLIAPDAAEPPRVERFRLWLLRQAGPAGAAAASLTVA